MCNISILQTRIIRNVQYLLLLDWMTFLMTDMLISQTHTKLKHFLPVNCLPGPLNLLLVWFLFYILWLIFLTFPNTLNFLSHCSLLIHIYNILLVRTILICLCGDILWIEISISNKFLLNVISIFFTSSFSFKSLYFLILDVLHAICFNVSVISNQCLLRRFIEILI